MKTILSYADIDLKNAPPRTLFKTLFRLLIRAGAMFLLAARLLVLACGYVLLAAGVAIHLVLLLVARTFLTLGKIRWADVSRRTMSVAHRIDGIVNAIIMQIRRWLPRPIRVESKSR